jgi:hypothetical protein
MLLYPTTVIFQVTRAIQRAVENLKAGRRQSCSWRCRLGLQR